MSVDHEGTKYDTGGVYNNMVLSTVQPRIPRSTITRAEDRRAQINRRYPAPYPAGPQRAQSIRPYPEGPPRMPPPRQYDQSADFFQHPGQAQPYVRKIADEQVDAVAGEILSAASNDFEVCKFLLKFVSDRMFGANTLGNALEVAFLTALQAVLKTNDKHRQLLRTTVQHLKLFITVSAIPTPQKIPLVVSRMIANQVLIRNMCSQYAARSTALTGHTSAAPAASAN